jgi:DNA-binding response OmpR family regulator
MPVLVVDDDENILHTLTLLLRSEGMECVACHSPQEALAALRRDRCQLALVDLNYFEDTTSSSIWTRACRVRLRFVRGV